MPIECQGRRQTSMPKSMPSTNYIQGPFDRDGRQNEYLHCVVVHCRFFSHEAWRRLLAPFICIRFQRRPLTSTAIVQFRLFQNLATLRKTEFVFLGLWLWIVKRPAIISIYYYYNIYIYLFLFNWQFWLLSFGFDH